MIATGKNLVSSPRYCCDCHTQIFECMAFVQAGDFMQAVGGLLFWFAVRERCGRCVLRISIRERWDDLALVSRRDCLTKEN